MRPPLAVFGTSFRCFRRTNLEGSRFLPARRICLAADFLDTGYTHCLWWDSDIIATPDQVARLLSHDEAIVGGLYANKSERRLKWVLNPFGETTPNDNRGILPVRHIGTGFLLVAREVFETMIKKLPDIAYKAFDSDRSEWDFFPAGVREDFDGQRRYFSETGAFAGGRLNLALRRHDYGQILRLKAFSSCCGGAALHQRSLPKASQKLISRNGWILMDAL